MQMLRGTLLHLLGGALLHVLSASAQPLPQWELPPLPAMKYRFTSYATTAPLQAADFSAKYFGGEIIEDRSRWLTHTSLAPSAVAAAVRFHYNQRKAFHDVYFVSDATKPSGPMPVAAYANYLHDLHRFDLQETWDWYQDWHLCFQVDDVDLIVYRLLRDNVPFVSRSHYSIYVEIPFGITFQFLGKRMALAWTENFNFCRFTDGHAQKQPLQIAPLGKEQPLPELPPSHHSYFSNHPDAAFNFTLAHTSGVAFNMSGVWKSSHEYADGRCALLRWVQFPSFQIHFVDQYRKNQGNLTVAQVEEYLEKLHGNMTREDAYFDNRVGFEVEDLAPFKTSLTAANVKYYSDDGRNGGASMIMQLPGGILFQLTAPASPPHDPAAASGGGGDAPLLV